MPPPPSFDGRQWELWQVPWQHEDGTEKRRPALLISSEEFNQTNDFLPFLKISTQLRSSSFRLELLTDNAEFALTGLRQNCFFYADKIQRIHKSRPIRCLGQLGPELIRAMTFLIQAAERAQG